jgi:DDE superfamily endonuclease
MQPMLNAIRAQDIPLECIYNWDETAMFYKQFPQYTLAKKEDDGAGMKLDKSRVSLLMMVNGTGSYRKIVMIGKSKSPRNTSNEFWASHGIRYFSNATAWMTREIFQQLLIEFDSEMTKPVVLILDNFSGHKVSASLVLKYTMLMYLPPNTTSKTQPLDAGLIFQFKVRYRKELLCYALDKVLNGTFRINQITLRLIVPWITQAFISIPNTNIERCFNKTLKLNFNLESPKEIEEDETILELLGAMQRFANTNVTPFEAINYAYLQEENSRGIEAENQNSEDEEEIISIPDQKQVLGYLESVLSYFKGICDFEEVQRLENTKEKLLRHLNFQ